MVALGVDAGLAIERGMRVPEPDELGEPLDDRSAEGRSDLLRSIVVAVDRATFTRSLDRRDVVLAGQQADVVDLRDASGEELDRPGREVPLVVAVERRVVGAVQLMDIDVTAMPAPRGSGSRCRPVA